MQKLLKLVVLAGICSVIMVFFMSSSQVSIVQARDFERGKRADHERRKRVDHERGKRTDHERGRWFHDMGSAGSIGLAAPAVGTDMWTGVMGQKEYFLPHEDNCDQYLEAFVQILPTGEGYCIEVDERPAENWEVARNMCLQENKRLPEIAEYQFACDDASVLGLNNMTGAFEWASNFAIMGGGDNLTLYVPAIGQSGTVATHCDGIRGFRIGAAGQPKPSVSLAFRCVH